MASSGQQILGFLLSLVGLAAIITATCMVEWKTYEGTSSMQPEIHEGLWATCSGHGSAMTCEVYESLIELSTEIQVTRAALICSIFLSSLALLVSTVGMKCTRFMDDKDEIKGCMALTGGIMFMVSGLLTLSVTSWYVRKIIESYHHSHHLNRYEIGNAVFVSWSGAILNLVGGAFITCRRCSRSRASMSPAVLRQSSRSVPGENDIPPNTQEVAAQSRKSGK